MERYKLEIINNDGDQYIRSEPATDGSWVMFKDVAALQARADRNAAEYARVDDKARLAEFLHKQEIAAKDARIAELEAALSSIARNTCCDKCQEAALVARAALGEKQ